MRYSIEPPDRIYVKGYGFLGPSLKKSDFYGQVLINLRL